MPEATIEIPVQMERVSAMIAETLLMLYQNRNSRLTASLRFLLFSALRAWETLGSAQTRQGHCPCTLLRFARF